MALQRHRRLLGRWFAVTLAALALGSAQAQDYPNRPLRIVVPFAPGGGGDVLGRLVAQKLSEQLKQPVVVDNKPGASTVIGTDLVAKAASDGYTMLLNVPLIVQTASLFAKLPYDPLNDLVAVTDLVTSAVWLAVGTEKVSARNLKEYVEAGPRQKPEGLQLRLDRGRAPPGTCWAYALNEANRPGHDPCARTRAAAPATHGPARRRGRVGVPGLCHAQVAGRGRQGPAAGGHRHRSARRSHPDRCPRWPSRAMPGFEAGTWAGLFLPAKTPPEIVQRLEAEVRRIVVQPDYIARIRELGYEPGGSSHTQFTAQVRNEHARWGALIRKAGVKLE
jgi:tripartite-type tricarboxylate transporter receptor subunit TctC